ncbi:uronate isomerase [Firmicutes bacterium CAG:534]|nr:uronate isomerase [Firmicutes bacterium CAG:534]
MKAFMDENFLLSTETAQRLFHSYAETMPVLDYHCHISPEEIATDRRFENITQVWLGGDHYKWRFMRSCGVDEAYITGNASDRDKFFKWAEVLGKAIGNPLYHWSHLELQRYFNYHKPLSQNTASEVWELCNKKLAEKDMSARGLIRKSNVTLICTTDDPIDSLCYHKAIAEDQSFSVQVLPAWRPDRSIAIEKPDFAAYMEQLSSVSHIEINSFPALCKALKVRLDFFDSMGCVVSDHGLDYVMYAPATEQQADIILKKRLSGAALSQEEILRFKTMLLLFLGREYARRGWVMQLHYGVKRNNNTRLFQAIGADTGYDCIGDQAPAGELADFLNALECTDELPKTILYSLSPNDNAAIETIMGCFQNSQAVSKLQHGSAWWFNDHRPGMEAHLRSLASLGNLSGFVGMLTDSRSFLSYTRHEYFRRILCEYIGTLVENGEFADDEQILSDLVKDISYRNAVAYFGFSL